jgi:hypothetical protein
MGRSIHNPLDELDEAALFSLIGEAWNAQFGEAWYPESGPDSGDACFFGSSLEIGKREFDALLPMLRDDLSGACPYGVVACVRGTIRHFGTWQMPASLVAALAVQHGIAKSNILTFSRRTPSSPRYDKVKLGTSKKPNT